MEIAVVGSGAGTTAAALMDVGGVERGWRVALVVGNNSRSGILEEARRRGVPSAHLSGATHPDPSALDRGFLAAFERSDIDLVVLAGYLRKLGPGVLREFRGRIVNSHPALLPAHGGTGMYGDRVHEAVLAAGERTSGASLHTVTENYDEGPVLAQVEIDVEPSDDVASLRARVQAAEKAMIVRWLDARAREQRELPTGNNAALRRSGGE